ncbi:class I SAM-dependent RNA methyltransferase [Nocardioides marmoraquaticus]
MSERPEVGDRLELAVGPVAHGGHCVARWGPTNLVVFVRHALPGEQVVAVVTEDDGRFLRADAVEVLEASPDRVEPPCPLAGPGLCGGCDLQHVAPARQRALKADVVREQLQRLAGLDALVEVEEVPPSLRWRSRMRYVAPPPLDGRPQRGLHVHRSEEVVAVDDCPIQAPGAVVTTGRSSVGPVETTVTTAAGSRSFRVAADGFWQPHVEAPRVLVETVLALAAPRAGERVLDLYAGVGLFSAFLAEAVGPTGRVTAVEGDRTAAELSRENLAGLPVSVRPGRVDRVLHRGVGPADVVVLDPPRVGAKRQVVRQVAALRPRAVVYVACDPAALARDAAYLAEQGYRLDVLRAFDLFPMTHHVECVARFVTDA